MAKNRINDMCLVFPRIGKVEFLGEYENLKKFEGYLHELNMLREYFDILMDFRAIESTIYS